MPAAFLGRLWGPPMGVGPDYGCGSRLWGPPMGVGPASGAPCVSLPSLLLHLFWCRKGDPQKLLSPTRSDHHDGNVRCKLTPYVQLP